MLLSQCVQERATRCRGAAEAGATMDASLQARAEQSTAAGCQGRLHWMRQGLSSCV